ncbi:MAG: hypothetical protein M2R45_04157 [Verrucomicrobia subdivision 3 bacterium]|nr:hypothetical protein [Limisphaerales bacterium]MCS1417704.1 hypothetical protein [Limisphaerales bacterium]
MPVVLYLPDVCGGGRVFPIWSASRWPSVGRCDPDRARDCRCLFRAVDSDGNTDRVLYASGLILLSAIRYSVFVLYSRQLILRVALRRMC